MDISNTVKPNKGYAVVVDNTIDVRTVADTERAAKVNYIYANGILVTQSWTDTHIYDAFDRMKEASVIQILIYPVYSGGSE